MGAYLNAQNLPQMLQGSLTVTIDGKPPMSAGQELDLLAVMGAV